MGWTPRNITDTELSLLRLLWANGPSTIRELTDALYPEPSHAKYATVQSLLDRLRQKKCVRRTKRGRANLFTATVTRTELVARRLRETADELCDGSMAPLLTHLARLTNPTPEEAEALASLVERLSAADERSGRDDR